ncbi:TatD DNase family protein [Algoriphagus boseongensis]|uniref:TatD DNase family protein n=1 Tax=Algoriphagus boseongensis TaxID=1442587 RepID=A0A4R6T3Y6_9BACT|nr:TatD family hydrolase [Algoriphagus boseongensis]TDQ12939.1 TatD DNase family protein [Algoriphagus boseongensis]
MKFWDFHTHQGQSSESIFNWDLSGEIPEGSFSVGLHPWFLDQNWEESIKLVEKLAKQNQGVLAIGECGFDRIKGPKIGIQKKAFQAQASLASQLEIPLILHCVKGHDLLVEYLKNEKNPPPIIWHGWNLKPELANQLLLFPVYFSFGKHLLIENSNASQWLKDCPQNKIFLETDDSNLPIAQIYQAASLILGLSEQDLSDLVQKNWNSISSRKIK